jgi:hypothetical protein
VPTVQQRRVYALTSRLPSGSAAPANASWQQVWIGAWLLLFPLFSLADFYVDQALKQFWIALPVVSLAAATWLLAVRARAFRSRSLTLLLWLLPAVLVWQSLSLWVFRLLFHNR